MKEINACLMFDGNCAEAMKFYQKCLQAELQLKLYSEAFGEKTPLELQNRIMSARLTKGTATLLGADIMPQPNFKSGNNFTVSVACESKQEVDDFTKSLGEGGDVTMPGREVPGGNYFGMLTDKYDIDWMFSFELPKT
jgi:PhnB protein